MAFTRNEAAWLILFYGLFNAVWAYFYPHGIVVVFDLATLLALRWAAYRYGEDESDSTPPPKFRPLICLNEDD